MRCGIEPNSRPAEDRKIGALWMRSIRFAGLARILHLFREGHNGFRAKELNERIALTGVYQIGHGAVPSATTLYHCRNTLLQIGALVKADGRYRIAERPEIETVLSNTEPTTEELNWKARDAFADLVLQNEDCQAAFFSLFGPQGWLCNAVDFRGHAIPVSWKARLGDGSRERLGVILESEGSGERRTLPAQTRAVDHSEGQDICSVLYGVRYWALHELSLIDEYFSLDRGSVMFPIRAVREDSAAVAITGGIIKSLAADKAWTTFSLQELIARHCVGERHQLTALHFAIKNLVASAPGKVVLIPSAESFAANALSATFPGTRDLELRSYYRDSSKRLISHVRLHISIARMDYARSA